ncbi:hypothetical protein CLF_103333, partial [Clonorchis sinensis]
SNFGNTGLDALFADIQSTWSVIYVLRDTQTNQKNTCDLTIASFYFCKFSWPTKKPAAHKIARPSPITTNMTPVTGLSRNRTDTRISLSYADLNFYDSLANPYYTDTSKRLTQDVYVRDCPWTELRRPDDVRSWVADLRCDSRAVKQIMASLILQYIRGKFVLRGDLKKQYVRLTQLFRAIKPIDTHGEDATRSPVGYQSMRLCRRSTTTEQISRVVLVIRQLINQ